MLFKRILSVFMISALLWPDVARCMQEEEENLPKNLSKQKQIINFPPNEEKTTEDPTPLPSKDLPILIVKNTLSSSEIKEEIKEPPPPPPENNSTTENKTAVLKEETPSKGEEKSVTTSSEKEIPHISTQVIKEESGIKETILHLDEQIEEEERNFSQGSIFLDDEEAEEKTNAFLAYFKKRVIDGWPTWKQVVGAGVGSVIGLGVGAGMYLIIMGDVINYMDFIYTKNNKTANFLSSTMFLTSLGGVSAFDALIRAASVLMSWDNADRSSFMVSTKTYKKRLNGMKFLAYTSSFFASFLPVYYVLNGSVYLPTPDGAIVWIILSLPQSLDTIFAYGKPLSDQTEKWFKKKAHQKHLERLPQKSEERKIEDQRQTLLKQLKKLMWILHDLSLKKGNKLYDKIFSKNEKFTLEIEQEKTLENIKILLQTYEKNNDSVDPTTAFQSKNKHAALFGWIGTGLASAGRHLAFWYSVKSMLDGVYQVFVSNSSNVSAPPSLSWPLSIIFGSIIGATVQGYFEEENLAKTYYGITGGKTVTEPQSWKPIRVINKIWNYLIQGPLFSLPYVATLFELAWKRLQWFHPTASGCGNPHNSLSYICSLYIPGRWANPWSLPLFIAVLIPFFLADAANNATQFNKTSGQWISAINRVLSYTPLAKYLKGYKRDKLIEIVHSLRELVRDLQPAVLKNLLQKLDPVKYKEVFKKGTIPSSMRMANTDSKEEMEDENQEEQLLLKKKLLSLSDFTILQDINSDYEGDNSEDIVSPSFQNYRQQKRGWFSTCWSGVASVFRKAISIFSSCRRSKKWKSMEDEDFEGDMIN